MPPAEHLSLDHVLIAVTDLAAAAKAFEARSGLTTIEGGRHPDWGTANRIVPLADAYLELVTVVDDGTAKGSTFGRWVRESATKAGHFIGWAVRTDNLDGIARRLRLTTTSGSRKNADDTLLRWRYAGMAEAVADSSLPFFIEWAGTGTPPGSAAASQGAAIARLTIRGNPDKLSSWLDEHTLPIEIEPGSPELTSVTLVHGREKTIVIDLS